MLAGQIEIQMLANLARLQTDMTKAKSMVGGAMKSIESSVASAKSVLASIGIGLSVGFFANLIKGSIDAMDHLRDLNKTTTLSVEILSGLKVAAKQSGTDLDGLAASINKLSQNMGKDAAKFAALGVSAKDPLEAFKQLADIFVSLEDPQQRAAVMAAALGKSWAVVAPLLAEGGQKIGEMVDRGTKLSGVTSDMADQADAFNDKLVLLTGTGGVFARMIGPILPLLNTLADDMLNVQDKAVGMEHKFQPLLEALKAIMVLGGNVSYVLKAIGNDLGAMAAQLAALGNRDWAAFKFIGKAATEDAKRAREEFDKWEEKIMHIGTAADIAERKLAAETAAQEKAAAAAVDAIKKKAAAAAAAAKAANFLSDPAAFNKLLADLEKATATAQMNILTDEKEKSAMRIEIARAEMLAKVDFTKLTEDQKKSYMDAFNTYSIAKTAEETKRSQGAVLDLIETWQNTTKQMQDASAKWLQDTADALTDFVTTGKADFKSLADSIIRDLIRIFIQQQVLGSFSSSTSAGTGLLGLVGTIFGFAHGGTHQGGARIVGENGPELEVTGPSKIYNSEQTKKMLGGNTYNIDARGADRQGLGRLEAMIRRLDGSIEHRSVSAVANDRARGGVTASL